MLAPSAVACDNLHLCAISTNNCGAREALHRRIDSSLFDFSTKHGTMQTLYLVKVYVSNYHFDNILFHLSRTSVRLGA